MKLTDKNMDIGALCRDDTNISFLEIEKEVRTGTRTQPLKNTTTGNKESINYFHNVTPVLFTCAYKNKTFVKENTTRET